MRECLKKKGQEGKVEAFVKGLNSGSFDIVNYDYLPVSRKFTGGKLLDKARVTNLELAELNGGDTQVEELSTNLDAEGKEFEDPDNKISNGLHER
ncbi:hypothetical protein BY996DRAFT_6441338 [Phakopsora pachyrhizi]|nr:hypothetical protein BY996DRAFT_6441338 [Phakopsora pachyrhizi]